MTRAPERTVAALLATAAIEAATRVLVEDEHVSLTGADLAARVASAAARLAEAGIGAGDRVALCLVNSVGFVEAFLGVLACGADAFVLAPVAPPAEVQRALQATTTRALVGVGDVAAVAPPDVAALASDVDGLTIRRTLSGHAPSGRSGPRAPRPTDPAFVAY